MIIAKGFVVLWVLWLLFQLSSQMKALRTAWLNHEHVSTLQTKEDFKEQFDETVKSGVWYTLVTCLIIAVLLLYI